PGPSSSLSRVMPKEKAFLSAILADPATDAPRLVFADWLEEHGRSERAEFIRVQCRLAALPECDQERKELETRSWELLGSHEEDWVGPLHGLHKQKWWRFHRGFIESISLPARVFLAHAKAIFQAAPVSQASLWKAGGTATELANCPFLARLTGLDFQ